MEAAGTRGVLPPRTRRRFALLITVCSLAGSLALAEAFARHTYGPGFENLVDPYLDHAYRPLTDFRQSWGDSWTVVHTNSLGWKDEQPEHRVVKSVAPHRRVVFLGDSFAEGLGYPQEQTLSGIAQRRLGPGFEILNGGQASYSPLLEYQRLKRFLAAGYRADAVVLLVDTSDVQDELYYSARYRFAADGEPDRLEGLRYQPLLRWLYDRSALARSLRRAPVESSIGGAENFTAPSPEVSRELADPAAVTTRRLAALSPVAYRILHTNWMGHEPSLRGWVEDGWHSLFTNLLRTQRLAEASGLRLLVVIYPNPTMLYTRDDAARYRQLATVFPVWYSDREAVYGTAPSPLVTEYQRRLQRFCREHSLPLLDLIPDFQRVEHWESLYIPGDVHFNAAGHRLAGDRIAQAVLTQLAAGAP